MFDDLPETIPHRSTKKPRAIVLAACVHVVLVSAIIVVQMAMPEKLGEFQLLETLYMAPPPPPPAALLSEAREAARHAARKPEVSQWAAVVQEQSARVEEKTELVAPIAVPRDMACVVE